MTTPPGSPPRKRARVNSPSAVSFSSSSPDLAIDLDIDEVLNSSSTGSQHENNDSYSMTSLDTPPYQDLGPSPSYSPTDSFGSPVSDEGHDPNLGFDIEDIRDDDVLGMDWPLDIATVEIDTSTNDQPGLAIENPDEGSVHSIEEIQPLIDLPEELRTYYEDRMNEFLNIGIDDIDIVNVYLSFNNDMYCFRPICLGEGTFSQIYRVVESESMTTRTPIERCVKVTKCEATNRIQTAYERELAIAENSLNENPHPNIIRFFDHFEDHSFEDDYRNYQVMEWSPIGSLKSLVQQVNAEGNLVWLPIEENYCRHFIRGIAEGVRHLHGLGIAHGDIKLENVLLFWKEFQPGEPRDYSAHRFLSMIPKLCDFNNSKEAEFNWPGVPIWCDAPRCSIYTAAPESWYINQEYDMKTADVYSVGANLLSLLLGCHPFHPPPNLHFDKSNPDDYHWFYNMVKKEGSFLNQLVQPFNQNLRHILLTSLEPMPQNRITIDQFIAHPWFQIS